MRCKRCSVEIDPDWQIDGVCVPCGEYAARQDLREQRRGYVPALSQPGGWQEMLIQAIQKIRFWRDWHGKH